MANIVITSTSNSVTVDFGVYASFLETYKQTWSKSVIQNFRKVNDSGYIYVNMKFEKEWIVSYNGATGTFQVDSIDGVTPTSNDHLFTLLSSLIA